MFNLIRYPINSIYNIKNKYFNPNTSAFDEVLEDSRDWAWWDILLSHLWLPTKFIINDDRFVNQHIEWYEMSCTAQGTCNAINNSLYIKADKTTYRNWFNLFDLAVSKWLASRKNWAYVIDLIKLSKDEWLSVWYYTAYTLLEIKNAIYTTNCVVTWSSKINWDECRDWLVKSIWVWYWHCFEISGWDNNKQIGKYIWALYCRNSYWNKAQDKWWFWIPYYLYNDILFNTRKAIIVSPEWEKISPEERTANYKRLKARYS